jgi:homogentisate 1,2-dioxygenase
LPNELETHDEKISLSKSKEGMMHEVVYATSFDVVGWDGYNFPYGFSIHNLNPLQVECTNRHQYIKL